MKIKSTKAKKPIEKVRSNINNGKLNEKKKVITSEDNNDIVSLILRDHEPIKKHLLILKNADVNISKKISSFNEFKKILLNHAKAEEQSLYIYMKKSEDLQIEGIEGDIEHSLADQLITEIELLKNDDNTWIAKVKVLAELVDHHIKEEEKEILKQTKKEFDLEERVQIGKEYSKKLRQFDSEGHTKIKPADHLNNRAEYV